MARRGLDTLRCWRLMILGLLIASTPRYQEEG